MKPSRLKIMRYKTRLLLNDNYKDFCRQEAFECHKIGKYLDKEHAKGYFISEALGQKLPYKAYFLEYSNDVGGDDNKPEPGALVEIHVGMYMYTTWLSHKDFDRYRSKKK